MSVLDRLGRPTLPDAVSGLVTGLFSIPEGMAYASIGGFNPALGLYSGMIPTIVGSVLARTVLMVTTLTSAIALTSHSVLTEAGLDPADPANIAALALVVGGVMLLLGLLRLGWILDFVSNAVMTGFTTGIALQILVGVLGDATGYDPTAHNTLAKLVDSITHVGEWDPTTVVVAVATIGVWAAFRALRPTATIATLIALVLVTAAVAVLDLGIETVGDIAAVPSALPTPVLPALEAVPGLLAGGVAVALVALAQAAGIGATLPNPDGSRTNASRDFIAQGVANVAGAGLQALPTGGSLSRSGIAASGGARTRWAGIFAGLWLMLFVVLFGSAAELIPMAVIGGLIVVIGAELLEGRRGDILLVLRTAPLSAVAMVVTFLATTQLPLQQAIVLGAVLSIVLYAWAASREARLVRLVRADDGDWRTAAVPPVVPSGEVTVLHYRGVGLFSEVPRIDASWPEFHDAHDAVLVLSVRTLPDVPSTSVIKELRRLHDRLAAAGCRLILAGVDPRLRPLMEASGLGDSLGAENIIYATDSVFGAIEQATQEGRAWIESRRRQEDGDERAEAGGPG